MLADSMAAASGARGAAGPRQRPGANRGRERGGGRGPGGEGRPAAESGRLWGESKRLWRETGQLAALLASCEETLDLTHRKAQCFVKFSEVEKMANIQAEINEMKLKTEILQLEKETADIAHPYYLGNKCEILQDMNRHLEAVLKEKRALRKRLMKPRCQDSLPIEATFHRYIVELLTDAANFIEKLESYLQAIRSIPQVPNIMKKMDTALTRTELLVMELEELAEQILKWREVQKEVYSDDICNTAELDFSLSLT